MKKILLVDDDKKLCNLLSSYLTSLHFDVNSVYDIPTALSSIKRNCPHLVISDIMMQDLDGYDLIKLLKLDSSLLHIPVIFLTAKGMTSDRIKGYNLGCSAYITKPFDPRELEAIINNIFNNLNKNLLKTEANYNIFYDDAILNNLILTNREKSILHLVLKGYMNKEIAISLNVTQRNVEKYISRLLNKTNVRNRVNLIRLFKKFT